MPIERGIWRLEDILASDLDTAKWVHTIARLKQRFNIPDPT